MQCAKMLLSYKVSIASLPYAYDFFLSHQKLRLSTNELFSSVFFFCGTDLLIGEFIHLGRSEP